MEVSEIKLKSLIKESIFEIMQEHKDIFYSFFYQAYSEVIEDVGMIHAINEIPKEDTEEASDDEIADIFSGKFLNQE